MTEKQDAVAILSLFASIMVIAILGWILTMAWHDGRSIQMMREAGSSVSITCAQHAIKGECPCR